MRIFKNITVFVTVFALVTFFSGMPLNTHQAVAKDKGVLKEVVFVHHKLPPELDPAKGKPVAGCTVTTTNSSNYGLAGWHMPATGLTYKINLSTLPSGMNATAFQNSITSSMATWEQATTGVNWTYGGSTTVKRSSYDGVNLVAFGSASGAIAVTRTWYWTGTGEVAESDMILSSGLAWSITSPSAGDCGGVANTYDVQNIATHEFGHQVGLNDLYNSADRDLTMYGYGTMKELKKDSLGTGDVNGAKAIY